ncbi:MAG TPA: hypothetical protein PKH94_04535 [Bacteroidales bacterium]|nr:hypothetical protein [Bacteroidales bacterium]
MKRRVLISISLFPLVLSAQETAWDSLPWGSGTGKMPASPAGRAWIIPAVIVPAGVAAAVLFWPDKTNGTGDPCNLEILSQSTPATCSSANGTASILLSDSTSPQVTWPDGVTASTRNDLRAGVYPVAVTYGDCTDSVTLEITSVNIPVPLLLQDVIPPSGPGMHDGAIVVLIDPPGNGPYLFTINGSNSILLPEPVFIAEGLAEGTYVVEVTDAQGCTGTLTVVLKADERQSRRHRTIQDLFHAKRPKSLRIVFTPLFFRAPGGTDRKSISIAD